MIIEGHIGVATQMQEKSTLTTSLRFWKACERNAAVSRLISPKLSQASPDKSFFRRDISPKPTSTFAQRAASVSPTKCKSAFGRLGTHFWGFETQNVIPDIVVLGKPIGNAFPLAAVVTTPEIAASFDNGMEFFSTFGGNPVACAAGLAVLDVLEEEHLQNNALEVGRYLFARLEALKEKHALIGDVRGSGLFLGLDLVLDRETRKPAPNQASYVVNRLRQRGILTGTDGPHHNVIKLRPPLIFSQADADLFVRTLEEILKEDAALPNS